MPTENTPKPGSHTYGLLRSGQSMTPFVLEALLQVPDEVYPLPSAKVERATAFIHANTQPGGVLGLADPGIPDYPNYATALAVSALCRARREDWEAQVGGMISYLRTQQFTEQNGWQLNDPAYGAWGMGGELRTPPETGHVDLSMSRYVMEAFRSAHVGAADPVFTSARVFVERCQNFDPEHPDDADGGFFFSTTESDTNKAGRDGKHFRSYGTTTADGILALLAAGSEPGDKRVAAARRWLTAHHHDMQVPGFTASLARTQRADGSWANSENLVKEDDPLIATAFAVRALAVQ